MDSFGKPVQDILLVNPHLKVYDALVVDCLLCDSRLSNPDARDIHRHLNNKSHRNYLDMHSRFCFTDFARMRKLAQCFCKSFVKFEDDKLMCSICNIQLAENRNSIQPRKGSQVCEEQIFTFSQLKLF